MGPAQFQIGCQVMHFSSVYNVLLGRPWIHSSGAVPFSLYQVLKFVVNDQLLTIFTEENYIVIADSEPKENGNRNASVSSYRTTDIVSVSWITSEALKDEMVLPAANVMMAKEMIRGGYEFDKGLGCNLQGILKPVELIEKKDLFGLGFRPTARDIKEMKARKKAEKEGKLGVLDIPPLRYTFPKPAEEITSEFSPIYDVETSLTHLFVGAISEDCPSDDAEFPDIPQGAIHNWTAECFPVQKEFRWPKIKLFDPMDITVLEPNDDNLYITHDLEIMQYELQDESDNEESYDDMTGISTDIVVHRLPTDPTFPPVKQRPRKFKPDTSLKIKEQIEKQLKTNIIIVSHYPVWLSNSVPVLEKNGEVRVCVDYRDLNKASPKDDFPLPNIHIILDNTAGHEIESFCYCFAGYHQILMAEEDREKTAFITPWGTFCYRVMPFGLKNVGATYQRTMTTLFHDMIHQEMEVYVDDIIIKSRKTEDHLIDLKKLFDRLRKYNLKLNPAKCALGAPAGKLLGFIVSKKSIEIDPTKIKAIRDMPVPKTQKDAKSFLEKINFIGRFIAQLTATCEPLFKLLKKNVPLHWNEECQQAFDKIKDYLLHHPILVPSKPGRPLIMYLSMLDGAVGCVLGQHDDSGRKEQAIYYLSKKFTQYEVLLVGAVEDMSELCPEWRLFFDGAANSFGTGIGAVLVSPERKHYPGAAKLQFACTNNMVEYKACNFGLKMTLEMEVKELIAFSDSDLLVHQTLKQWITKDSKILPYDCNLLTLARQFQSLEFRHLPRARNVFADALATLSFMIQYPDELGIEPLRIQLQDKPAHCWVIDKISGKCPWYNDIKEFIKIRS
nr:uncharacterized protein LOC113739139 [Coffea arabica]